MGTMVSQEEGHPGHGEKDVVEETHEVQESGDGPKTLGGLPATEDDILEARELAASLSLEAVREMMARVLEIHDNDPNFPFVMLQHIKEFLGNDDILQHPEQHAALIEQIKIEAALITNNSPYAEVRSVVDNHDDPTTPVSTIRAWTIGLLFAAILAFVNQLFSIRQPGIAFGTNVVQLLAFPLGKAWERWMPRREVHLPLSGGKRISLNPGRFNRKEHMLIAIMANSSNSLPYTNYIIWAQVLPQYFNQPYARSFGYMFLNGFATNFIGYGLAGITRRFLVYPSYCVWPSSLVTIALNTALHNEENHPVPGPFRRTWTISRYKFFLVSFSAIFVYFWFPNYLMAVLSYFAWMTWIAPNNRELNILTGMQNGLGLLNPFPTLDWNVLTTSGDPLMVPSFTTFNTTAGMFLSGLVILAFWYGNVWNTGYIPINTNAVYDHFGHRYNVSRAVDGRGIFNLDKYLSYSAPYLSAANALLYFFFFAIYSAIVTHVLLYHRFEVSLGFKNLWASLRWKRKDKRKTNEGDRASRVNEGEYKDVHNRLMSAYPEVSEWWYFALLVLSVATGVAGIHGWPTYTSPAVVLYGIWLCLMFVVPIGVVTAMTGIQVTLNVLAEFVGGMINEGNALAMNFFKSYGYVTCAHAVSFAADLKIAHYVKIPPRVTFAAQLIGTFVSTIICTGVMQYQINIPNVCTKSAPMRFFCPGNNTFFTASILWGTIGPIKIFGKDAQYSWLLMGFPFGVLAVLCFWLLKRRFPESRALRQVHVVAAISGGLQWAPYSFSYAWPAVPVAWLSWIYIRSRYLAFWSKYNFVLSASLSAGIALSALVMVFSVQWAGIELHWWGNDQPNVGCEGTPCLLKTLAEGERFYPWWDGTKAPAP